MSPTLLLAKLNSKLATWSDKTTQDVIDLVQRGVMTLPPGTKYVPDIIRAQLRVIVGLSNRESALAGQQLQARLNSRQADAEVLREDRPLVGVTATARRVVSDLRPAEHITQRMPKVLVEPYPDDEVTLPMGEDQKPRG